jgi:guanosine-3',5'-bis(diphosphate) 3'-pyrophosphohydrolase
MKRGEMLDKALHLAVNAHHGQFDKGGKPYILHPLRVMSFLKTDDEELQCMALLHDVIEDTDTTYLELMEAGMSTRVIEGIMALTKERGFSYDQYKDKIFKNRDAMQVKMADLRHNTDVRRLKGVAQKDIQRMAKYHAFYLELRQKLETV